MKTSESLNGKAEAWVWKQRKLPLDIKARRLLRAAFRAGWRAAMRRKRA